MIPRRIATVAMATVLGVATMTPAETAEAAWPGAEGSIYFVCRSAGGGFAGQDICRINPDGTGLTNLTNTPTQAENVPDVSPTGAKVSFVRTIGVEEHVWIMNPDGSGQQQVTTVESDGAAFTPDGGAIAYRAKVNGTDYEFQVQPLAGGAPTTLRAATGSDFAPRYAANGSWLYATPVETSPGSGTFTSQVFVVDGSGIPHQVTASATAANSFPSWSPHGATVVYSRISAAQTDLYAVPSGGGAEVRLTNTALPVKESWAQYSPDGTHLVFQEEDATHDFFHLRLAISNADGSNPVPLATPGLDYAALPVWAPSPSAPPATHTASFSADAPAKVKPGKQLQVTLRCLGDLPCVVTYGGTLKVPGSGKVIIKDKTVTLSGATTQTVPLKLRGKAKKAVAAAVKAGKKPKYLATVVARQTTGALIRSLQLKATITP